MSREKNAVGKATMKTTMKTRIKSSKKRIIYCLCFFFICLTDQRTKTGSGLDGWIETFRVLDGGILALLVLAHYDRKDFAKQKIPYVVWSLICVIGGAFFIGKGQELFYFRNHRIALTISFYLWGIALMRTGYAFWAEQKRPQLRRGFAILWLVMFLWMIFSRSEYSWPLAYFVMFSCFYLTDYSKEDWEELLLGMADGVILAFFMMQGWCFVFRPYDAVRYVGVYGNCNMNALFYLLVLAGVWTKLLYTFRRGGCIWWKLFYFMGTGVVLAFLFMTISRTGWFVAVLMVFVGLVALGRTDTGKKLWRNVIQKGLVVILCFVLCFPLVFGAVRYLPPVFHHPVWFFGEWNEDKVHSWDAWDSDKFVSLDRFLTSATGRVMAVFQSLYEKTNSEQETATTPHLEVEGVNLAETKDKKREVSPLQQQLYDEAYAAGFALEPDAVTDPIVFRGAIYRYYVHLLNVTGHPESEQGFQILPYQRIGHAHNIYLQYGVDFGIPVLLLFAALVIWSGLCFAERGWKAGGEAYAGELLFLMVPALFGLLEYSWGSGSAPVFLLFVVWRRMICHEREC